jgi:hypothetical protein
LANSTCFSKAKAREIQFDEHLGIVRASREAAEAIPACRVCRAGDPDGRPEGDDDNLNGRGTPRL